MLKIFEVGGCVRDALLGIPSKDIDFAVEAESFESMEKEFESRGFRVFQRNPQFFTIRAKFPDKNLVADFVLCRRDVGGDGRHPEAVVAGTIFDDLSRRDFTVNAIARDEQGRLIDPHNGVADLKNQLIRCVGDPNRRFEEDALRVLRALRFSITKNFQIDASIWKAFNNEKLPVLMQKVSTERKREELEKMFKADSLRSIDLIASLPTDLKAAIFVDVGLWLKPTLEKR